MYKRNGNKGITLIALVITIIVLLILAGVSIAMLSGDNSIMTNATKARRDNAISSVKEQVLMAVNTAYTDYHAKLVTNELDDEETLYKDTKTALEAIEANQSEIEYTFTPASGEVRIHYKKDADNSKDVIGHLKDEEKAVFSWD